MVPSTEFDDWFAAYLGQQPFQVKQLLQDGMATRFLIAWSIFESKCFNGFVKINCLSSFAEKVSKEQDFARGNFEAHGQYFHNRYQNHDHLRHLLHGQKVNGLKDILDKQFEKLRDEELLFMLLVVVYRFRNNIFHGNKGVDSWLQYRPQIEKCTNVMQHLITLRATAQDENL